MFEDYPRRIPLVLYTIVLAVAAWCRRAYESTLLLLPARPAARPPHRARTLNGMGQQREVPAE